jgi:hypothetical protein
MATIPRPFEMLSAISKEPDFSFWQIIDGDWKVVLADHVDLPKEPPR